MSEQKKREKEARTKELLEKDLREKEEAHEMIREQRSLEDHKTNTMSYYEDSTPAPEYSESNTLIRVVNREEPKKYMNTSFAEESRHIWVTNIDSITKIIQRHNSPEFGITEYLDESNLEKIKIEEEDSNDANAEFDDDFEGEIDNEQITIGPSTNLTRNIVKARYSQSPS